MKIIDSAEIESLGVSLIKSLSNGDSFRSIASELNLMLEKKFGVHVRPSFFKYCRDNYKDISPATQPILTEIINQIIFQWINHGEKNIVIEHPNGLYNLAQGLGYGATVDARGFVGGSFGAYNNGAVLISRDVAGRYCGNNSWNGLFVLYKDVDEGFGLTNHGADFIIFGKAMSRGFAQARGGSAIVRNGLGDYCGMYMAAGILICFDGNIGKDIGSGMVGGTIYLPRDKITERTIGEGARLVDSLNEEDANALKALLPRYRNIPEFSYDISTKFPTVKFNDLVYLTDGLVKIQKK